MFVADIVQRRKARQAVEFELVERSSSWLRPSLVPHIVKTPGLANPTTVYML